VKRSRKRLTSVVAVLLLLVPSVVLLAKTKAGPKAGPGTVGNQAAGPIAGRRQTAEGWFAAPPKSSTKVAPKIVRKAFVIPITGPIDSTTGKTVRRKVARCRAAGADMVIFEMDTPGGRSDVMDQIVRLILDDLADTYVVAFVNPRAFSAGAVISLACDEIVMTPTAVLGDAMPIMLGPKGIVEIPDKERGKIESAALAEIRLLAKRNGYNQALCEAMITITREVWLIKNTATGELRAVNAGEWRSRVSKAPVTTTSAAAAPAGASGPGLEQWQYVRTIVDDNKLVTMTNDEAVFLGFVKYTARSMKELEAYYHIETAPTVLANNWSETLVEFLSSAPVVAVLFFAGLLFGYIELHTPGFGVAGSIAIGCFALLFGGSYLTGLAAWWEIAVFILGLVLLIVEVFVTPGFGVLGLSGLILSAIALLAMVVPNAPDKWPIPQTNLDWSIFTNGLVAMMVGFLMACAAAVVLARYLPRLPVANKLILQGPEIVASAPAGRDAPIRRVSPGAVGTIERTCRPVGQVRIGPDLIDAVAEGQFLAAGTEVRVIRIEGNRVVVTQSA